MFRNTYLDENLWTNDSEPPFLDNLRFWLKLVHTDEATRGIL